MHIINFFQLGNLLLNAETTFLGLDMIPLWRSLVPAYWVMAAVFTHAAFVAWTPNASNVFELIAPFCAHAFLCIALLFFVGSEMLSIG